MLRREADGVAWKAARRRLRGQPEPAPSLVLTFVTRSSHAAAARLARWLEGALAGSFAEVGAVSRMNAVDVHLTEHPSTYYWDEPDRFERGLSDLRTPDADTMTWSWSITQEPKRTPNADPGVSVYTRLTVEDEQLWEWQVVAGLDVAAPPSTDDLAQCWRGTLRGAAERFEVVWGAVYYDAWDIAGPPYERYFLIQDGVRSAAEHPRGYYWCNLLNPRHLELLDGLDAVSAACAQAGLHTEVVRRAGTLAGLLVTDREPATRTSDATLAAVQSILAPTLIVQPYWWYAGPQLRVFKEPGTAYRPIPADIVTPWFDDDQPLGPGSGSARRLVPDN